MHFALTATVKYFVYFKYWRSNLSSLAIHFAVRLSNFYCAPVAGFVIRVISKRTHNNRLFTSYNVLAKL